MCKKKIMNKFKLFVGMLLCASAMFTTPVTTIVTYAAEVDIVEPCTDIREWVYKVENGKLYKALFNRSTGQLETDWTYVCDWPPEE